MSGSRKQVSVYLDLDNQAALEGIGTGARSRAINEAIRQWASSEPSAGETSTNSVEVLSNALDDVVERLDKQASRISKLEDRLDQ